MPIGPDLRLLTLCVAIGGAGVWSAHRTQRAFARDVQALASTPADTLDLIAQRQAVQTAMAGRRPLPAHRAAPATADWHTRWFTDAPPPPTRRPGAARTGDQPRARERRSARPDAAAATPIDVDRATAASLEQLPRVGPALAARIVTYRERCGAFGSLEALDRVAGVGPALLRTIAGSVTFSGTPRPSDAPGCAGSAH